MPANQPVAVVGGNAFTSVTSGHAHSCGLTADGTAWCWGDDSQGQLGDGGPDQAGKSAEPVRVHFDVPFASLCAGYYQTCALTATAEAWCWGANRHGELGATAPDTSRVPLRLEDAPSLQTVFASTGTTTVPTGRVLCLRHRIEWPPVVLGWRDTQPAIARRALRTRRFAHGPLVPHPGAWPRELNYIGNKCGDRDRSPARLGRR